MRVTRRAMASTFEIALPYGTPNALPAAEGALDLIDELESQLTVYRDTSEATAVNAAAADGPVRIESRFFNLLQYSAGLTNDTAGAFDVCTGALTRAWGFYRREGRVPSAPERAEAMARCGTRHLMLDPERETVKFRVRGLEINLGAIGKGYALDRAVEYLVKHWGIHSALLSVGGSSVYALGHPPGDPMGWPISVRHPWDPERSLGTVRLIDRGFGTSAATVQHFVYNGRKLGHLLDPRTGWPSEGVASASAAAPTATEADAMSTAFYVLGADAAEEFGRSRPHLGGLILTDGEDAPRLFGLL
ncbi:MAG: FAD:protein FMN transferase [Gemmataceae bacterium]|nr:FAD:protein FMN transferase [Gemmataceae bacterium]